MLSLGRFLPIFISFQVTGPVHFYASDFPKYTSYLACSKPHVLQFSTQVFRVSNKLFCLS